MPAVALDTFLGLVSIPCSCRASPGSATGLPDPAPGIPSDRNLERFLVGFQGKKESEYIELSSNRPIVIDKAYWYWSVYH